MRLFAATTAAALTLLAVPTLASAHPPIALIGVPDPVANVQTSANVTHVQRFPEHRGSSGGRLHDGRFYITDSTGVHVYDVADPLDPVKLGSLLVPQSTTGVALGQEDPDTNGRILLLDTASQSAPTGRLTIVDVSDPANMSVLATVGQTAHTWTCINDCTFAYGRDGEIIDLNDPSAPVVLDQNWRELTEITTSQSGPGYTHDVTEMAPGRAMSAGQSSTYIDTTDAANPVALAVNLTNFHTFGYHGVEWANGGLDEIAVFGTEIAPDTNTVENTVGSDCQDEGSIIATYSTKDILAGDESLAGGGSFGRSREFELLDTWLVQGRGAFVDGQAPGHILYCAHWFNLHPEWFNGGLFAAGYYEWGTRIVEVANDGTMTEYGWFLPSDGYTSAAYWITRDVLYTADYVRGMDIIQVDVAAAPDPSPEGEVASGDREPEDLPAPEPEPAEQEPGPLPVTGAGAIGLAVGLLGAGWGLRLRRRP